jgi:uncharacterized protein YdhG (YjbR/CyaY superfamily)
MNEVQEYIATQRPLQKEIMSVLRRWILDLGPHAQEKISYTVPFFYFYGPLCYLNPVAEGVDLSFTKGNKLSNEQNLLEDKKRKTVASVRFHSLAEVEEREEQIRQILNEAAILNQYLYRTKKKSKK